MIGQIKAQRWLAAAAIVGALVLAAACGSSGKQTSSRLSNAPPSNPGVTTSGDKAATGLQPGGEAARTEGSSAPQYQNSDSIGAPAGTTGADPDGASGANPASLPSQLDRKIIQTATLDITVDAVSKNFENVGNVAAGFGGFVASSQFGNDGDRQTASVTIRVPADKYQDALIQLRKLGEVKGENSGANDVTEEYTDLTSRAKNLRAVEAQYVEFLGRAANISEVLTVQDRLNATRAEIDQVQGRIGLMQRQTDLATITVHLAPPPIVTKTEPKPDTGNSSPLDVAADSFQASLAVLLGIATVVLAVAAFSWWLVPVAVVALVVLRKQMRATDERRAIPPAPPAAS